MSWYTGFATYAINWGLVMFMVLPWGSGASTPKILVKGTTPAHPLIPVSY